MQFVIVGAGALGSVIGAALFQCGEHVTLLGRESAHLQALQRDGLHLTRLDGTVHRVDLAATSDPRVVAEADAVIVLVKTVDTVAAMRAIRPYLHAEVSVLALQNGIGNVETIAMELQDRARVLPGVTSQAAMRTTPGAVTHAGEGPTFVGYRDAADAAIVAELATTFSDCGLPATAVPDIERYVWRKVAVNAAINGLTALGGVPNGAIVADSALLTAATTVVEEAAMVARALGIAIDDVRATLVETANATAANRSSMLQDLEAGRPTEVGAIHEAIVAAGRRAGVATPVTQAVAALIRARERSGNPQGATP